MDLIREGAADRAKKEKQEKFLQLASIIPSQEKAATSSTSSSSSSSSSQYAKEKESLRLQAVSPASTATDDYDGTSIEEKIRAKAAAAKKKHRKRRKEQNRRFNHLYDCIKNRLYVETLLSWDGIV